MANTMLDDYNGEDELNMEDDVQEIEQDESVLGDDLEEDASTNGEEEVPLEDPETGDESVAEDTEKARTALEETPEDKMARALEGRLRATIEEREKRQNLQAERDELQRRLAAYEAQQNPQQEYVPDAYLDPIGFAEHIQRQNTEMILMDRVERSMDLATQEYGQDLVAAARNWGARRHNETNGWFTENAMKSRDPAKYLVQEFQKATKFDEFSSNEDAYFERMARAKGWAPIQSAVQNNSPVQGQRPKPPRKPTLAEMESTRGGAQDQPPVSMLD